ncbi:MAG: hypothetical protein EON59_15215 [Alphaproteobacteria bacterium]|nr:MAG: hypothetical protein EON59_15215 [Alphaproteobacteria bacterium]
MIVVLTASLLGCTEPIQETSDAEILPPRGAASAALPAYDDPVVMEWAEYNSACRGNAGPDSNSACQKRDALTRSVEARGWCYERGPSGGHDWLRCPPSTSSKEEAETRRKLDLIGVDSPPQPNPHSGDQRWFIAAAKLGRCEDLVSNLGASTPDEVVVLFAANGMPLEVTRRDAEMVLVRDAGNPADPGMAFVKGQPECEAVVEALSAVR